MSAIATTRAFPRRGARRLRSKAPRVSNLAVQVIAAVIIAAIAAAVSWYSVRHGSLKGLSVTVAVVGSLWFAATKNTQLALALLTIYLGALDGYLKLSTGSSAISLVRDGLLYAIVVGQLLRTIALRKPLPAPPLHGWIVAFCVLVAVQLFNPLDGSILHSFGGIRQDLEFVPLFYLTFAFVRTKKALRGFVIVLALLATLNGVVNVMQSRLSPAQLATWGPGYAERELGTGEFSQGGRAFFDANGQLHVRPFGLMSDAGTGGMVCILGLGCVLALASMFRRPQYLAIAAVAGAAAVAGIVTSEGRSVVVGGVLVVLAYGLMAATARNRVATIAGVAALVAATAFAAGSLVAGGSQNRYGGLTSASGLVQLTTKDRGLAFQTIPSNLARWPFGAGLGSGGPAAGVKDPPAAVLTANTENEISFATLDVGIPGMLTLIGFALVVFLTGVRRCRFEPDAETRLLLAALISPLGAMLAIYTVSAVSPTTPFGPYLWAAGGVVSYWLIQRPREQGFAAPRLGSRSVGTA
jgi:hypothetical protein